MDQGNFFRLDQSSRVKDGVIYFRYLPFVRKNPKGSESDYPIYIQITGSAINFYIQRRDQYQNDTEEKEKAASCMYYQHTELFYLPLMMNLRSRDNLQKTMNEVFVGKEPFNKSEYSFPFPDYNKDSYSELGGDVFGKFLDLKNKNEINLSLEYKRIFLDFLFDLEHSTVFKNSPYYEQMEESLREDAFFTALSAKAEYYYNKKIISDWIDKGVSEGINDKSKALMSGEKVEKYIQSLAAWLNHIRKPVSEDLLYNSEWFDDDIEKEYKSVIFARTENKAFSILRKIRVFIRRYYMCQALGKDSNEKDKRKELKKRISKIRRSSNKWFIRRYAWFSAIRCKILDLNIILPRLIMATASAWILFVTTEEIWKTTVDTSLDSSRWILGLMLIPILFLINEIRNIALHKKAIHYFGRTILILVLGYIISFSIGWFFTKNTSEKMLVRSGYLPDLYIEKLSYGNSSLIKDANIDSLIAEFNPYFASDTKKEDTTDILTYLEDNNIEFSCNQILYDNLFILKMDSLGSVDTKNLINASIPDTVLDADSAKVFEFLSYLKNNDINISGHQMLYDNLHILKPDSGCSNVPIKCEDKDVFPHLLFFRAFLALFVGLFLQLVFEDKPVTEPL